MKTKEIPSVQTFDQKQLLKRVEQEQQRFVVLTNDSKAKGLRTDGVGPCIVLCGKISNENQVLLGMYHWSGSSELEYDEKISDAKSIFKQFCAALRRQAVTSNIADACPLEIVMIGGELETENSSGTRIEQGGLELCLNEKNSKKYNINLEGCDIQFNKKELADEFISVYLISSGVYFKRYTAKDNESKAYSSSSSSGSPNKLKEDMLTLKEEVSSIKNTQQEEKNNLGVLKEDVSVLKGDVATLKGQVDQILSQLAIVIENQNKEKMQVSETDHNKFFK